MKTRMNHSFKWTSDQEPDEQKQAPKHGWLRRLLGTLNFMVVIIFLGAWIAAFIFLDQYLTTVLSGNILTDLTCISFFGGLIFAFLIAAIASNLLRRFFWKFSSTSRNNVKD